MDGQFQMHLRFCKQKHGVTKRRKKISVPTCTPQNDPQPEKTRQHSWCWLL